MRDSNQYLRFSIGGAYYLISGAVSVAIDQRDSLEINQSETGQVSAWRLHDGARWPAYCLDRDFKIAQRDAWEQAIFLEAQPTPAAGHLFSGAWVVGSHAILVFDPKALTTFLRGVGA